MKTFLAAWLAEAPKVFGLEMAEAVGLQPSSQLPIPETAIALSIEMSGWLGGRFLVIVDRDRLHTLLTAAWGAEGSAEGDREFWESMVRSIAVAATATADPGSASPASVSVKHGEWELGLPAAAWELRFGEIAVPIALIDEIEPGATAGGSEQPPASAASTASTPGSQKAAPGKFTQGGVELLLGVELEASLRFGSREMPLNEVLGLGAGDVVELDRNVTDPVDLLVGDKIVARGEVVIVEGSFGLRVLEVTEPKKCLENIRCLF